MGQRGPLLVRQGDVALHKEQTSMGQHGRDHAGNFTQVRAAARRKTLLLLWWIDGGKVVGERSTLARQGLPQGSSDYTHIEVCVSQPSIPFYGCHGPPFIDQGVTTVAK